MMILKYHLRKKRWLFLFMLLYEIFLVLPTPYRDFFSYHLSTEMYFSLWVGLFSALIMTCEAETEFAVCYGASMPKLVFSQWLPHFLYPFLAVIIVLPITTIQSDFGKIGEKAFASSGIRVLVLAFSAFVTFLFLSALMLFLRVIMKNVYASFGGFFTCYFALHEFRRLLIEGKISLSCAKYDLWLTGLIFETRFSVTEKVWLLNRYGYLFAACLLLFFSFFLLRKSEIRI